MAKNIKKKVKRFHRKNKRIIYSIIGIVILIAIIFQVTDLTPGKKNKDSETKAQYEITEIDLFSTKDFKSNQVSIHGLMLGDNGRDVLEKLGTPDIQNEFPPNIVNFEYSKSIDLEETGIIIHTQADLVKRITFKKPFDKNLKGKTKADYEKKEIYWMFGTPDEVTFEPLKEGSSRAVKTYHYHDKGLEIILLGSRVIGFALV